MAKARRVRGTRQSNIEGGPNRSSQRFPSHALVGNSILARLPPEESTRLRPLLQRVSLKPGDVIYESQTPIGFVYFPNRGMVSMVSAMRDGATVEVGMTGAEGFVGTAVLLGEKTAPVRAIVQMPGDAFRIESAALRRNLPSTPQLEQMLRRYAHAHWIQVAQAAACNRLHQVRQRLCRWLLMSRDRAESDLLPLTHEFLAQMLGCRRSSVTATAGSLERSGAIRYKRGQIRIVNRGVLEKEACECYAVIRRSSGPK